MAKNLLHIVYISVISLFIFWLPFIIKIKSLWGVDFGSMGMDVIVQNFDGLNFLVIAKSMYDPTIIAHINTQFLTGNDPIYFSAHFPLFAVVIKIFDLFFSLPYALLATVIVSNILLVVGVYSLAKTVLKDSQMATILTTITLFFPARMLAVRSVGSNEPLFIFFVMISLTLAIKSRYWLSTLFGSLAVLTRSPGILLFFVYFWVGIVNNEGWRLKLKKIGPYLLMPITLLGLFVFYGVRYHDPFAYFHSGDNLHLFFPPFQIFSNTASWINDMWREDVVYLYLFYGIGIAMISERWSVIKKWGLVYGLTLLFVVHRDLARYALPIAPIALIGYAPLLQKIPKKMWIIVAVLLIPIYLFSWQFVLKNIQPINDWGALL